MEVTATAYTTVETAIVFIARDPCKSTILLTARLENIKFTDRIKNQLTYSVELNVQRLKGLARIKVIKIPSTPVAIDHLLSTKTVLEKSTSSFCALAKATILTPLMLIPKPVMEEIIASVFCNNPTVPIPVVPRNKATNLDPTRLTSILSTCEKPKTPVAFNIVLCEESVFII